MQKVIAKKSWHVKGEVMMNANQSFFKDLFDLAEQGSKCGQMGCNGEEDRREHKKSEHKKSEQKPSGHERKECERKIKNIIDDMGSNKSVTANKNISATPHTLHQRAMMLATQYKQCEAELLDVIIEARDKKLHRHFGLTSIFEYCVQVLKLDPGVVYGFAAVAKKIKEVPELKEKIAEGALNVSTAKRITSVLSEDNKAEWFQKAAELPARKLEQEVARVNPKAAVMERTSYVDSKRVKLILGLGEDRLRHLRRAQDLVSQKRRCATSLEDVLGILVEEYLYRHDPVERAKRSVHRQRTDVQFPPAGDLSKKRTDKDRKSSTWKRTPIPSHIRNQVNLRDRGQCQHRNIWTKKPCSNERHIEVHHIKPLSRGGGHSLENLITLCSEHHRIAHAR